MAYHLVTYDVPSNKRRRKIASALLRFGPRVQESVFVAVRGAPAEIARALAAIINPQEDDVRIHPLCATCSARSLMLGLAQRADEGRTFRII